MSKVISAELHFEAVDCLPFRTHHYSGVVYKNIDFWHTILIIFGELSDGCQRRQIQFLQFYYSRRVSLFDIADSALSFDLVATSYYYYLKELTNALIIFYHDESIFFLLF